MKSIILTGFLFMGMAFLSCSETSNCKECTSCKTKASITLCEDNFEKYSDYSDQVDNYVSDGCTCSDK